MPGSACVTRAAAEATPFTAVQYALARHLRDPDHALAPADVDPRRLAVYRELLYNNVERFLAGYFPVLRRILGEHAWHAMIGDYFARHRARTPLFPQMPREFLRYLDELREGRDDPPFLRELAHYEWMEAALAIDPHEPDLERVDAGGDLLDGCPVLSPLAWPLRYAFPVHRIGPDYQPRAPGPQPTYLLLYRDAGDVVRFLELNTFSARLVELLGAADPASGRGLLERIARESGHPQPQAVIDGGAGLLADLRRRTVVLGVRA